MNSDPKGRTIGPKAFRWCCPSSVAMVVEDGVPITEGDLMGGLGKHRIDRAGHDAGTGLHRRRGAYDCPGPSSISDAPQGAHA